MDFSKQLTRTGQMVNPMRQLYRQWLSVLTAEDLIDDGLSMLYGTMDGYGIGVVDFDSLNRPIIAFGYARWGSQAGKDLVINADDEFMTPYLSGPGDRARVSKVTNGLLVATYAYSAYQWFYRASAQSVVDVNNITTPVTYYNEKLLKGNYYNRFAPWMRLVADPDYGSKIAYSREGTDLLKPHNKTGVVSKDDWNEYDTLRAKRLKRLERADAIARGVITSRARRIPTEAEQEARLQADIEELMANLRVAKVQPTSEGRK